METRDGCDAHVLQPLPSLVLSHVQAMQESPSKKWPLLHLEQVASLVRSDWSVTHLLHAVPPPVLQP